ncbi:periplasmic protein [Neiella marina]|uniref:Periplasmic protein n=1 Tax=Neiella marina TaxID=508461 RepID=A0A8J2XQD2_9GAMM|nr:L-dopachrome tautomerase-related protein [Neiella marina]GGA82406.1 periplasmic protein [Neiella marina]
MTYRYLLVFALAMASYSVNGSQQLEIHRTLNGSMPPANIAVTADNRLFMSSHLGWGSTHRVVEVLPDGAYQAYPDYQFSPALGGVLGIVADRQGVLWFLDSIWGDKPLGRVIGWDTLNNRLFKVFHIAYPFINNEFILNDLAVDRSHGAIYISETAGQQTSAILVIDIDTGAIRRVLQGSQATVAEDKDLLVDGEVVKSNGTPVRVGVNPITIDEADQWLYFAPMSSSSVYRVETSHLVDDSLSPTELEKQVERYAAKPMSDGITIDSANNLYISDLAANAIGVITPDRQYQLLHQDSNLLSWIEGFANAGEYIYVSSNKLHDSPVFNNTGADNLDFFLLKFKPLAPAPHGR